MILENAEIGFENSMATSTSSFVKEI